MGAVQTLVTSTKVLLISYLEFVIRVAKERVQENMIIPFNS